MPFEVEKSTQLPAGVLLKARLDTFDVKEIPFTDKKTGEQKSFNKIEWIFKIIDGEFSGKEVRGETGAYLTDHPENKFRNWSEALLNRSLDLGFVLDETDLLGGTALITVKYVEDRKDSDKKWPRVDDVIALAEDEPPF